MKKKILIGIYAAVQLAVIVLILLGLIFRQPIYFYIASPLAFVAIVFIIVYLKKTSEPKK